MDMREGLTVGSYEAIEKIAGAAATGGPHDPNPAPPIAFAHARRSRLPRLGTGTPFHHDKNAGSSTASWAIPGFDFQWYALVSGRRSRCMPTTAS